MCLFIDPASQGGKISVLRTHAGVVELIDSQLHRLACRLVDKFGELEPERQADVHEVTQQAPHRLAKRQVNRGEKSSRCSRKNRIASVIKDIVQG